MNSRPFILTGIAAVALCLVTTGHLGARGIIARPAPTIQRGPDADTGGRPMPAIPGLSGNPSGLDAGNGPSSIPGDQSQFPTPVNRASRLIGMTVRNPKNEPLGKIKEVVIDLKNSRVPYVVLTRYRSNNGSGTQLAVPLTHFTPSTDQRTLILNADRAQLEHATGFSGENLPSMSNPAFDQSDSNRREILVIPVPVQPDQDQIPGQDEQQKDDVTPPHLHKRAIMANP